MWSLQIIGFQVVFHILQVHNLHTGAVTSMSATELVHRAQFDNQHFNRQENSAGPSSLAYLAATGVWQVATEKSAILQSGNKHGG